MTSKDERLALVKILADLTERQTVLQSKVLAKVIHHLRLWVNRLYRDATRRGVDIDNKDSGGV